MDENFQYDQGYKDQNDNVAKIEDYGDCNPNSVDARIKEKKIISITVNVIIKKKKIILRF